MSKRIILAFFIVSSALVYLIYQGVSTTAKAVVTVNELLLAKEPRMNIRLGARMTDDQIEKFSTGEKKFAFFVRDITGDTSGKIKIESEQGIPDTLKAGRDVILEGNFDGQVFIAKNLMTQCPSKYEAPKPQ